MEAKISLEDWKKITSTAIGNVCTLFEPKEIAVLMDFVQTVTKKDLYPENKEKEK